MEALSPEVIEHILEVSEPTRYSALLRNPANLNEFVGWCQESRDAQRIIEKMGDEIYTFSLDQGGGAYCIAMSIDTLSRLVKDLAIEYEDRELDRLFRRQ